MATAFAAAEVAISLMKEALTLLDEPEAAPAALHLQMAINAASDMGASAADASSDEARDVAEGGE